MRYLRAEYGYNAEDYRCYKNVQENGFFDETYYFYEGTHVIMEADSTGTINAHNMYGTHLAARTVDGQSCYYLYNAHGDVVMLMDAVTGEVAGTYQYDAFGTLLWSDGYADNNITYAGYQYDEESGLYYLNARYYDSTTARFLTEDTYRGRQNDPLSLNRYTYCQNNPVHYTDPSGHSFLGAALAKFVGGAVINGVVELASQVFIEKREKVDWGSVLFEAAVGGVEGVFGGTGGKVVKKFAGEVLEETAEYGLKKTAKKVTGVVVHDAVSGFATDVAYQKIVEDKSWDEVDYGSAVRSAAVDGLMGGVIELGSDAVKSAVGSFNTSRRNVDINVDPGVDVDVDAPKKKTDAPSSKTDTTTKKSVDVPEAEPAPKSTLPDMPEKAKSAGASVSSTPNMPKSSTPELPSVSNKATEVMDELGDSVPTGSRKMNLQFFADDSVISGSSSRYDKTGYQSSGRSNNLFGRDRSTRRTANLTEWRRSISKQDIHNEMRLFLGDDYVKIDSGKWRSLDGNRQFRVKPDDYLGNHGIGQPTVPNTPHVHFEFLTPRSNGNGFDVIKNIHVPIK